jgi:excisionase family DNA binding protein
MEGYVTTAEAARIIGCVSSRVRQLLRDQLIAGERVGRDWLVLKASAEAYAAVEHRPGPKPKPTPSKPKKGKG